MPQRIANACFCTATLLHGHQKPFFHADIPATVHGLIMSVSRRLLAAHTRYLVSKERGKEKREKTEREGERQYSLDSWHPFPPHLPVSLSLPPLKPGTVTALAQNFIHELDGYFLRHTAKLLK